MEKEDIHATSVKGVGEINPPRKQGEDAEGKPIEEHPKTPPKISPLHTKDVIIEHPKEENHKHKKK
jgi:hypothetical protein